jgi:ParB family chromosome partitioning protein
MSKKAELKMIDPDDLVIVGLDTNDGPDHELYDERALEPLDEALVKNVSVYGVLQPVTVREQGGQLFVVDGRQRVRAARSARNQQSKAGEFEIRVPYTTHGAEGADRQQLTGIMVSANEQRRADEVLVKAAKAARMKALGASLDEVAIAFGRSTVTIRNWLSLLEADDAVLDAVRDGTCAVSAANEIVKYPKEEQAGVLNTLLGQTKNGRVTESMAKGFRQLGGDSTASSDSQAKATANAGPVLTTAPLTPKAARRSKGTQAQPVQTGIKRTWLRKALKTQAAASLTDEQKAVLVWISAGTSDGSNWFDEFQSKAEKELSK